MIVELEIFEANKEKPITPHVKLRPPKNKSSPDLVRLATQIPNAIITMKYNAMMVRSR